MPAVFRKCWIYRPIFNVSMSISILESVFAVIAAAIILNEAMSPREMAGCLIMFAAIIISQISESLSAKKKSQESAKSS